MNRLLADGQPGPHRSIQGGLLQIVEVVGRKNRLLNKADESQVTLLHKSKSGRSEWLLSKEQIHQG